MRKCDKCGAPNPASRSECYSCSHPFVVVPEQPIQPHLSTQQANYCTHCGATLPCDANYCPSCGMLLQSDHSSEVLQQVGGQHTAQQFDSDLMTGLKPLSFWGTFSKTAVVIGGAVIGVVLALLVVGLVLGRTSGRNASAPVPTDSPPQAELSGQLQATKPTYSIRQPNGGIPRAAEWQPTQAPLPSQVDSSKDQNATELNIKVGDYNAYLHQIEYADNMLEEIEIFYERNGIIIPENTFEYVGQMDAAAKSALQLLSEIKADSRFPALFRETVYTKARDRYTPYNDPAGELRFIERR